MAIFWACRNYKAYLMGDHPPCRLIMLLGALGQYGPKCTYEGAILTSLFRAEHTEGRSHCMVALSSRNASSGGQAPQEFLWGTQSSSPTDSNDEWKSMFFRRAYEYSMFRVFHDFNFNTNPRCVRSHLCIIFIIILLCIILTRLNYNFSFIPRYATSLMLPFLFCFI